MAGEVPPCTPDGGTLTPSIIGKISSSLGRFASIIDAQVHDWVVPARLAEAIEKLRIPLDGASLAQVLASRDRLDAARPLEAVGEFDVGAPGDIDSARL